MYSFEMEYDIAQKRYAEMRAAEKKSGMLDDPDEEELADPKSQASLHKTGFNLRQQMSRYRTRCSDTRDRLRLQPPSDPKELEKLKDEYDRLRMEVALRGEKMWFTYNAYFSRSAWDEEEKFREALGLRPLNRRERNR